MLVKQVLVHGVSVKFTHVNGFWIYEVPGLGDASIRGSFGSAILDCQDWVSVNRARFTTFKM